MAGVGGDGDKTLDGSKGKTVRTRPPEEIITLSFDGDGQVAAEDQADGAGAGGGRGREGGRGRSQKVALLPHDMKEGIKKFSRPGEDRKFKGITDKKLNGSLKRQARRDRETVFKLTKAQVLQTAEPGFLQPEGHERTHWVSQEELEDSSAVGAARKRFFLDLPYGPYHVGYSPNGQHMLGCGGKGHIAHMSCENMGLKAEVHVKESIRAVQPMHSEMMFAVAQKKYTYIYDHAGVELHCLKDQRFPTHLDFLRYHFLLVTAGENSDLFYRDISTGTVVASHRTRLGPTRSMRQNPNNGVMHLGHSNGTMTMWTPTVKEPIVQFFCHNGAVSSCAIQGNYMVTAGSEALWKVWDLRKYEVVHSYRCLGRAVADIDISMTGLVALGYGAHVQIWKDVFRASRPKMPYMKDDFPGQQISSLRFRPYEDVLGVGHSGGFGTLLVPGAGFANFDSLEANPFEDKRQRREKEVHSLLEKLQPDTIMLDPSQIGNINVKVAKKFREDEMQKQKAEEAEAKKAKVSKKMRGKNKVGARMKRKNLKEGKDQREKVKGRLDGEEDDGSDDDSGEDDGEGADDEAGAGAGPETGAAPARAGALGRFYGKRRRKT